MNSEIKEVVYIAVSLIILSIVLGFVAILSNVQGDIAQIRNNEVIGNQNLIQAREFNKYDRGFIIGPEVVEVILKLKESDISVQVYTDLNNFRIFNLSQYLIPANEVFYSIEPGSFLLTTFNSNTRFRTYLIYNNQNITEKFTSMRQQYLLTPERVSGTIQQKINALDRFYVNQGRGAKVTGILIVNIDSL